MPKPPTDESASPSAPAALLFDCDGTLLLTADLHYTGMAKALQLQGLQMPRDWYMTLTGLDRARLFERFMVDFAVVADLPRLVADSIALTVTLAGQARENPLVARLARGAVGVLPTAVVTNSEAAIARAFLRQTGLHDLFDCIITVDDVPRPKPAPDIYMAAALRLGVSAELCLVLEDSDQGIESARTAGMQWIDVRSPGWPSKCQELLRVLQVDFSDAGTV
ncbi:MAG: HAD family phosphatase [Pseudotabrizicola sp.]|uniref:HAD family hydrolase n=1 Tax=Pseudotabrizicola sp. TaxID=2939647 RepID=UPI002728255B|nr:HAD family phosphatase [Pseudotabrizicola sp.]MDO9641024.1 HAD family phosphatase [Pseudotabrizicola sp.]